MPLNLDSLAEVYRAKTDEELRILASDSDSLVEEARGVLANEIRLRAFTGTGGPKQYESHSFLPLAIIE